MRPKTRQKFASAPSAPSAGVTFQRLSADTAASAYRPHKTQFVTADAVRGLARTVGGRRQMNQPSAANSLKSRCKPANILPADGADAKLQAVTALRPKPHSAVRGVRKGADARRRLDVRRLTVGAENA